MKKGAPHRKLPASYPCQGKRYRTSWAGLQVSSGQDSRSYFSFDHPLPFLQIVPCCIIRFFFNPWDFSFSGCHSWVPQSLINYWMDKTQFFQLLQKYRLGTATEEE